MTLDDLLIQLFQAQKAVNSFPAADAVEKIDLDIAVLTIKRAIQFKGFDALSALDTVALPDLSGLPQLVSDLQKAINDEKKFNDILGKVLSIAKLGTGAIGLPLPI